MVLDAHVAISGSDPNLKIKRNSRIFMSMYFITDTNCLLDVLNLLEGQVSLKFKFILIHLQGKYPTDIIVKTVEEGCDSKLIKPYHDGDKKISLSITDDGKGILLGYREFKED